MLELAVVFGHQGEDCALQDAERLDVVEVDVVVVVGWQLV